MYKISIHDIHSKLKLIELLYKDATVYLERKKEKAMKIYHSLGGHNL